MKLLWLNIFMSYTIKIVPTVQFSTALRVQKIAGHSPLAILSLIKYTENDVQYATLELYARKENYMQEKK